MLLTKRIFLFFLFLWSFTSSAHNFYFAFAEVEYNELGQRIEATISLTSHDFEENLAANGTPIQFVSGKEYNEQDLANIENALNKGFKLVSGQQNIELELEGMDIQLNGTAHFFLSAALSAPSELTLTFDLLMDTYSEQQNKMNFIYRDHKDAYVFMQNQRTNNIELYRNEQ